MFSPYKCYKWSILFWASKVFGFFNTITDRLTVDHLQPLIWVTYWLTMINSSRGRESAHHERDCHEIDVSTIDSTQYMLKWEASLVVHRRVLSSYLVVESSFGCLIPIVTETIDPPLETHRQQETIARPHPPITLFNQAIKAKYKHKLDIIYEMWCFIFIRVQIFIQTSLRQWWGDWDYHQHATQHSS